MPDDNPNTRIFQFCPRCGHGNLSAIADNALGCRSCDFVFYLNAAAAVAALILRNDTELLVVERNQDPHRGAWDLPGGFCAPGETAETGLQREIREELGLEITSARYFCSAPNQYHFQDTVYTTLDLAYICTADLPETIRTNHEIASVIFVPFADIAVERFGLKSIQAIVTNFKLYCKAGERPSMS